jgi:DAK2 domain fusion protein YloV
VLSSAVSAGRRALAETQNQLPALRQAGVVDAGGLGFLLLVEGALRHLQGKRDTPAPRQTAAAPAPSRALADVHAQLDHADGSYGYCTEFLIAGAGLREDQARSHFQQLGDSLLVVGGPDLLRVHIHTDDPGRALSYATTIGRLRRVKVQDMREQYEEFAAERPADNAPDTGSMNGVPAAEALPVGIVAVATGEGFSALFASLGAAVVPGGQTMNPSTEQILAAVDDCPQETVIVLPNNGNVVLTAQQAAGLSSKTVHVLRTETVPQGIAALLGVRYDEQPEQIAKAMADAATKVRTAEITSAVRDVEIDGLQVRRGDILGLLDGKLTAAGADTNSVLADLLDRMAAERYEVATLYRGQDTTEAEAEGLAEFLRRRYPELQVDLHQGGQPHYRFVLSVE